MPEMDEHISTQEGVECEIACAVTGIAADDNLETSVPEGTGPVRSPPLQAGRELEGNRPGLPFAQLADNLRDIV